MKRMEFNILYRIFFCYSLLISFSSGFAAVLDYGKMAQDFVLEEKQIVIPDYPAAFNPSLVRWRGGLLMSFRVLVNPENLWHSQIGLVWLDEDFNLKGLPQLLDTRVEKPYIPSRSEDARLYTIGDRLYVIYNDSEAVNDGEDRRMCISEIVYDGISFSVIGTEWLRKFDGENRNRWEKNWTPFDFKGKTLLAYSLFPHRILMPIGKGRCKTLRATNGTAAWDFGQLRGGVPAQLLNDHEYLGIFHSSCQVVTTNSNQAPMWHYFMGAYTFAAEPPFAITRTSPQPIVGRGFYDDTIVFKKVIFPGGFIFDDSHLWIAYGRDDSQCWIAMLDKELLLKSLLPVQTDD